MKFDWACGLGVVLALLGGMVGAVDDSFALQAGGGVPLGSDSFVDVPVGHWADEAVGSAVSNGVMVGAVDDSFVLQAGGGVPLGSDSFVDVPVGHWADEAVGSAVSNGVMVGAVDDSFVLQAGGGVPLGSDSFVDVPVGHWADEAVGWAVSNGVMEGVGGGRFDLEGVVPRWQIVSALYGAFGLAGGKGEAGGVPLGSDSFVDVPVGHVADVEVGWAVSVGITRECGWGQV